MSIDPALPASRAAQAAHSGRSSAASQIAVPPAGSPEPDAAPARASAPRAVLHALGWAAALAALLLTFSLYTQPDFMLKLANQLWFCA